MMERIATRIQRNTFRLTAGDVRDAIGEWLKETGVFLPNDWQLKVFDDGSASAVVEYDCPPEAP